MVPGARTRQVWRRCRRSLAPKAWRAAAAHPLCSSRSPMPAPTALGSHALQCSTPGPGPTPGLGIAPGTRVSDPLLLQRGGHSSTPSPQMCQVGGLQPVAFLCDLKVYLHVWEKRSLSRVASFGGSPKKLPTSSKGPCPLPSP